MMKKVYIKTHVTIKFEACWVFLIFLNDTALFPAWIVTAVQGSNNEGFKGNEIIDYSAKWPKNNPYFLNCVERGVTSHFRMLVFYCQINLKNADNSVQVLDINRAY